MAGDSSGISDQYKGDSVATASSIQVTASCSQVTASLSLATPGMFTSPVVPVSVVPSTAEVAGYPSTPTPPTDYLETLVAGYPKTPTPEPSTLQYNLNPHTLNHTTKLQSPCPKPITRPESPYQQRYNETSIAKPWALKQRWQAGPRRSRSWCLSGTIQPQSPYPDPYN